MISFRICLALFVAVPFTHGYPSRPGACPADRAAVNDVHLTATDLTRGSLVDGGLVLSINGQSLTAGETIALDTATTHTVVLEVSTSGGASTTPVSFFRGFLMRLGETESSTLGALTTNDPTASAVFHCDNAGVGSIGHISGVQRTSVAGALFMDTSAANMPLDVTVVVEVRNGKSVFYYDRFFVTVQSPTVTSPTTTLSVSPSASLSESTSASMSDSPPASLSDSPTTAPVSASFRVMATTTMAVSGSIISIAAVSALVAGIVLTL